MPSSDALSSLYLLLTCHYKGWVLEAEARKRLTFLGSSSLGLATQANNCRHFNPNVLKDPPKLLGGGLWSLDQ